MNLVVLPVPFSSGVVLYASSFREFLLSASRGLLFMPELELSFSGAKKSTRRRVAEIRAVNPPENTCFAIASIALFSDKMGVVHLTLAG